MRDYRDAKAMAHTLREALAAKNFKITVGESLELIARLFGVSDWNTLSAIIKHSDPAQSTGARGRTETVGFAPSTEEALFRTLGVARDRAHAFATAEHLLLSLTYDPDAAAIMKACAADPAAIRESVSGSAELGTPSDHTAALEPSPSADFQRVVQRAILDAQASGGGSVTGANLLVAIFSEEESTAVRILREHGVTRRDALKAIGRAG
ncbi:MAG: hypothetical protein JF595_06745 [Sphingomonadales bacterium]|nr:hypothetical protein [Sphingomonadales bacterium]